MAPLGVSLHSTYNIKKMTVKLSSYLISPMSMEYAENQFTLNA